jgi:protein gp37
MYEFIPKEIIAAVDTRQVSLLRQACDDLEDRTVRRFNSLLGVCGVLVLLSAAAFALRPDLVPGALQGMVRLAWALGGLGLGLLAATAACVYAWRQREKLLLAQASSLISRMEKKCALKVVLRWWSKAKSVSDIPSAFKDLAVRILETRELTLKDAKLYAKAVTDAGRIVGEYRRDYVFAQKLGLPLPGQAGLPSPQRAAAPAQEAAIPETTVVQEAPSVPVQPAEQAPAPASKDESEIRAETSPPDVLRSTAAPASTKPLRTADVVQFRAAKAERRPEPSQYQFEQVSVRQLPSAALDVATAASALGWSDSHLVRMSLFAGLPREWPGDQQVRAALEAMRKADWHTFMILTPHPRKLAEVAQDILGSARHIWAGTTVSRQEEVAQRVPALADVNAALRFVHVGPRESLTIAPFAACESCASTKPSDCGECGGTGFRLNWVVAGGTSGPTATPIHANAYRQLRDEAQKFGHFTFSGWGDWVHEDEVRAAGEGAVIEAVERSMSNSLESVRCKDGGYAFRLGAERPFRTLDGVLHSSAPAARARATDRFFAAHG